MFDFIRQLNTIAYLMVWIFVKITIVMQEYSSKVIEGRKLKSVQQDVWQGFHTLWKRTQYMFHQIFLRNHLTNVNQLIDDVFQLLQKISHKFPSFNRKFVSLILKCRCMVPFCCSNKFFKVCHIVVGSKILAMCGTIQYFMDRLMIANALFFWRSKSMTYSPSFTLKLPLTSGSTKSINSSLCNKLVTQNFRVS